LPQKKMAAQQIKKSTRDHNNWARNSA